MIKVAHPVRLLFVNCYFTFHFNYIIALKEEPHRGEHVSSNNE